MAFDTYIHYRNNYLKKVEEHSSFDNHKEFLRSMLAISVFWYLYMEHKDKQKIQELFRQFCQLSGLSMEHLTPKYFSWSGNDTFIAEQRLHFITSLLCSFGDGSLEVIKCAVGPRDWRSNQLDISVTNVYEWSLVEYFENEILSQNDLNLFSLDKTTFEKMAGFIEYLLTGVNFYSIESLTEWLNLVRTYDCGYLLNEQEHILTKAGSKVTLDLDHQEIQILKNLIRGKKTYLELVDLLGTTMNNVKKEVSLLKKKIRKTFGQSLVQKETVARNRPCLLYLERTVILVTS